ncbi:hypothetical protein VTL71DRAFT_6726 [Oculimacula yallundae]|uniref:Uncharacterized protein n=1 Tax=Oculimacula yallundae TaxID=86028 RepID=A0ABR4BXS5_9HELO
MAALPVFGTSAKLVFQAQYRKDPHRCGPIVEQNLTALVSGMPKLTELIWYKEPRMGLALTLRTLHLEDIALEAGHIVELFMLIRNHLTLDILSLNGWLVEVEDDSILYNVQYELCPNDFRRIKRRRIAARKAIELFVLRTSKFFPAALLDIDSPGSTDFSQGNWVGMTVVLGASKLEDTDHVDSYNLYSMIDDASDDDDSDE